MEGRKGNYKKRMFLLVCDCSGITTLEEAVMPSDVGPVGEFPILHTCCIGHSTLQPESLPVMWFSAMVNHAQFLKNKIWIFLWFVFIENSVGIKSLGENGVFIWNKTPVGLWESRLRSFINGFSPVWACSGTLESRGTWVASLWWTGLHVPVHVASLALTH